MNTEYTHKKFDMTPVYNHKKFGLRLEKRSRKEMETDVQPIIQTSVTEIPAAKRRQTTVLFRPWLKEAESSKNSTTEATSLDTLPYHSQMVRQQPAKQRSPKEQLKRERNTLACLKNRRAQHLEQIRLQRQYAAYKDKHITIQEEAIRANLYLRQLQMLQRQTLMARQLYAQYSNMLPYCKA